MKIIKINITIEPSEGEDKPVSELMRLENKTWIVESDGNIRGLFPSEIKLANNIQDLIIMKYNGEQL